MATKPSLASVFSQPASSFWAAAISFSKRAFSAERSTLPSSTTKTSTPLSTTAMLAAGFSTSAPMTSEAVFASGSMVERRLSSFSMSSAPARTTTSSSALGLKR